MQVSKYETIAQSFLDEYPVGTVVTANTLLTWIKDHADGAALKEDLDIADPSKRFNAVKRHLNNGGSSDAMAEDRRFYLQVEDVKRKTLVVRAHSDAAKDQATNAIGQSIVGAISPLKRSKKAIDAVKLDELPEIERQALEEAKANIEAMEKAVKPTLAQEVSRIWNANMAKLGIDEEQAEKIRQALPAVTKLQKLLQATT